MARCKKCGIMIADGRELCADCEAIEQSQEKAEKYLDTLLGSDVKPASAIDMLQQRRHKEDTGHTDAGKAGSMDSDMAEVLDETDEQEGMVGSILGESSLEQLMTEEMAGIAGEAISDGEGIKTEEEPDLTDMEGLDDISFDDMEGLDDIDFDSMEGLDDIDFDNMEDIDGLSDIDAHAFAGEEPDTADTVETAAAEEEKAEEEIPDDLMAMLEAEAEKAGEVGETEEAEEAVEEPDTVDTVETAAAEEEKAEEEIPDDLMAMLEAEAEEAGETGEAGESGEAEEAGEEEPDSADTVETAAAEVLADIEDSDGEEEDSDSMDLMLEQLLDDLDNEGNVGAGEETESNVSDADLEKMMDDYMGSDEENNDLNELLSMVNAESDDSDNDEAGSDDLLALEEGFDEDDLLALEGFDEDEFSDEGLSLDDSAGQEPEPEALDDMAAMDALLGEEEIALPEDAAKPEKKKGFFAKLFGNVVTDEIAKKEMEARKAEEEEAIKKEEERKQKEEQDAAKKAEKKEQDEAKKAEKQAQKEAAKKEKEAKKAEKKAKKQAEREAAEKEAELEVVGNLNKAGVGIVFALAIIFVCFVIFGTKNFSYSSAMADAKEYYENKRYAKAYEEMAGLKIKKKDQEFYDKVVTIMKVYRHIDSYGVYKSMKRFPEALDALLKGLKKYNTYYDDALYLEIEKDMDGCKEEITQTLTDEFDLTEDEAYELADISDQEEYNKKIVDIVIKQMETVMEESSN